MEINGYKIIGVDIEKYTYNGNLAITLNCLDDDICCPYATITVNLDEVLPKNQAYLDTNNCVWVEDFIKEYELGTFLGKYRQSGFCKYPLYELDIDKIKKIGE